MIAPSTARPSSKPPVQAEERCVFGALWKLSCQPPPPPMSLMLPDLHPLFAMHVSCCQLRFIPPFSVPGQTIELAKVPHTFASQSRGPHRSGDSSLTSRATRPWLGLLCVQCLIRSMLFVPRHGQNLSRLCDHSPVHCRQNLPWEICNTVCHGWLPGLRKPVASLPTPHADAHDEQHLTHCQKTPVLPLPAEKIWAVSLVTVFSGQSGCHLFMIKKKPLRRACLLYTADRFARCSNGSFGKTSRPDR